MPCCRHVGTLTDSSSSTSAPAKAVSAACSLSAAPAPSRSTSSGPWSRAARHRSAGQGAIVRSPATPLPIASATVDTVVSYIVWVDVPDFRSAIAEAARVLKPGGHLVAANLGFITASPGWERAPDGRRLFRPVDQYVDERPITLNWRGHQVVNWHRPLSAYMQAYLSANLTLRTFLEPVPPHRHPPPQPPLRRLVPHPRIHPHALAKGLARRDREAGIRMNQERLGPNLKMTAQAENST